MINLLPSSEKKKLQKEYLLRLSVALLVLALVLEVLALVLFVPTYYTLLISTNDLRRTIAERAALMPQEDKNIERELSLVKKEIALLKPGSTIIDVPPSALIGEIVQQKPQGITLSAISYVRGPDSVTLQFSGRALAQEDLLVFRRSVQANPRVLDFKYGSSFVTKKTDIDFTTTITFRPS